jgi:RNA polymerase sigma factor (sigma-70 family)
MKLETLMWDEREALVSRLASVLGGDHHAAEDLAQETFARAWRGLPAELDPAQQRAWLRRTSRNLAVDELRRRRRRLIEPIEHLDRLPATAEAASAPDAAREALTRLSVHERFVLRGLIPSRPRAGFARRPDPPTPGAGVSVANDPRLTLWLARERADDLRRAADSRRLAGSRAGLRAADGQPTVTLRLAGPDDARALARLAELDDAPPLTGRVLLADVSGSPAAALSLSDLRTVADPFEPTAELVQLLLVRARQLRHANEGPRRPRLALLRALLATTR